MIELMSCCAAILIRYWPLCGTKFNQAATAKAQWTTNFLQAKSGQGPVNVTLPPASAP